MGPIVDRYCMFGELPALMLVINQLVDYHIGRALGFRIDIDIIIRILYGLGRWLSLLR